MIYPLDCFLGDIHTYLVGLDALLLEKGIDMDYYQREFGICLFKKRDEGDLYKKLKKLEDEVEHNNYIVLSDKYIKKARLETENRDMAKSDVGSGDVPDVGCGDDVGSDEEIEKREEIEKEIADIKKRGKVYFNRAVKRGIITEDYKRVKGKCSKSLLGCFVAELRKRLEKEHVKCEWAMFDEVFDEKDLKRAFYNYHSRGTEPKGKDLLDKIFRIKTRKIHKAFSR